MRNMRVFTVAVGAILGLSGLVGCGGSGTGDDDDTPAVSVEWITEPPTIVARNQAISAAFEVVIDSEELTVSTAGLVACEGAVPDCGLNGTDSIAFMAGATLGDDGVYTADLTIPDQGQFTVTAYAHVGGDHTASPRGVVVDKMPYPEGPYGYAVESIVEDFGLQGFIDSDDADDDPFNEEARQIKISEFFQGEDLDAKLILINVGAGWCPVCAQEMQYIAPRFKQFYDRGIRILNVVDQDDDSAPPDLDFAKTWAGRFSSKLPTAIDPYDKVLGPYFTESAVPMNIYIDASTMQIVEAYAGYDVTSLNSIFDYYAP